MNMKFPGMVGAMGMQAGRVKSGMAGGMQGVPSMDPLVKELSNEIEIFAGNLRNLHNELVPLQQQFELIMNVRGQLWNHMMMNGVEISVPAVKQASQALTVAQKATAVKQASQAQPVGASGVKRPGLGAINQLIKQPRLGVAGSAAMRPLSKPAPNLTELNPKSALNTLRHKIFPKEPAKKEDIMYVSEQVGDATTHQYISTVTFNLYTADPQAYQGEVCGSKTQAENSAAQAWLDAHPDLMGHLQMKSAAGALPQAVARPSMPKTKGSDQNGDVLSRANEGVLVILGRNLTKDEITFEVSADASGAFTAQMCLPAELAADAILGEPAETEKAAKGNAARAFLAAYADIIEQRKAESAAKKQAAKAAKSEARHAQKVADGTIS